MNLQNLCKWLPLKLLFVLLLIFKTGNVQAQDTIQKMETGITTGCWKFENSDIKEIYSFLPSGKFLDSWKLKNKEGKNKYTNKDEYYEWHRSSGKWHICKDSATDEDGNTCTNRGGYILLLNGNDGGCFVILGISKSGISLMTDKGTVILMKKTNCPAGTNKEPESVRH